MEQTNEETLKHFARKGFLLDADSLDFFSRLDDYTLSEQILNRIVILTKGRVISKKILQDHMAEIKPLCSLVSKEKSSALDDFFKTTQVKIKLREEPVKTESRIPNVKILSSNVIPYRKIEMKDFVSHFKNRYNLLKDILKERKELDNLISINKIGTNRNFSLICMVSKKRITKNKNLILEIEDLTGRINALINFDKEDLFKKAKEIVLDDVIALKCSGGGEILYVNDVFFADSFIIEKKKSEEEVYALFISDIHVGSKLFLENNFNKFLNWINGIDVDEVQLEKINRIKYIFITGDNVDGVGVYPGQESLLSIKDVKNQYKKLAEMLNKIPKRISMIMCPGQHDAVRVPEPQPAIDEEFAEDLMKLDNLFLVSNPATVEIEAQKRGVKVTMYHGASMHGWIDEIDELRQGSANLNPSKVVKQFLKHRLLSPMHASNVYVPSEKEDFLALKEVPDILVTGDMHRTDIDTYNNVLIVCCSCWQSMTPFEEKVGNQPDPCKVPMLNLKSREIKILDFSGGEK